MIRRLIPCLLTATVLTAASYEVNLDYEALALKNGQALRNVRIKSYDHGSGKVIILVDRTIQSLQLELLPDEVAAKVGAMVPEEAKALAREDRADRKQAQRAQSQATREQQLRSESQRRAATAAREQSRRANEEAAAQAAARARTKQLARERALHYFTYENRSGSGSSIVLRQSIILGEPEEVPGWPGRTRVSGSIGLQSYDSRGRSFDTSRREFEVTVARNAKGDEEVIDFTVK